MMRDTKIDVMVIANQMCYGIFSDPLSFKDDVVFAAIYRFHKLSLFFFLQIFFTRRTNERKQQPLMNFEGAGGHHSLFEFLSLSRDSFTPSPLLRHVNFFQTKTF